MCNKLIYLFATFSVIFLSGCSGSGDDTEHNVEEQSIYGGVFRMPIGSYFSPIPVVEVQKLETAQVYDQVFEGLVKYNPKTLEIEPSLASEWQVSEDGLMYTFTLRDEVYFHDNACFENGKGRKLTAEDVIYTFKTIYSPSPENRAYYTFKNTIAGGDEFYKGKAGEISGIKAEGNKITFQLTEPSTIFLQKMAAVFGVIVPKEALEAPDFVPVGTGPFIYDNSSTSEIVRLSKNPKYHGKDADGKNLPYLDSVVFKYYEHSEDPMELFWSGTMSYIPNVPITRISEVLEERISDFESKPPKYILISEPQLSTTYLEFNMTNKVLKNKKVRKAINHAINRQKLVEKIMKNQAYEIGKFGMTPPLPKVFKEYDFEGIEDVSYQYNPELAKKLLAEAGYPEGRGFPTLTFQFRLGNDHYLVASEIQNQLRSVLNINVEIEAIEFNDLIENQAHGRADIFRTTWFGDYPSPETWLLNAYGKIVPSDRNLPSYVNSARFQNAEFDKLFEEGIRAATVEESYKSFAAAEKVLMDEAPFIVLWYGEDMMLVQSSVHDLETNGMRYLDLRGVYFREPTIEEYTDKKER